MNVVLMITLAIALVIYPKKNVFIDKFVLTLKVIGLHIEISTKEKSVPPSESEHSNPN